MRFFIVLVLIFLTGCEDLPRQCDQIVVSELTTEQIRQLADLCGKPTVTHSEAAAARPRTLAETLAVDAAKTGMSPEQFLKSDAGQYVVAYYYWKLYGSVIIGLPMILIVWWVLLKLALTPFRFPSRFETRPVLWGLWQRVYVTQYDPKHSSGGEGWYWLMLLVIGCAYTAAVYFAVIV